jgi:hypothetical protein
MRRDPERELAWLESATADLGEAGAAFVEQKGSEDAIAAGQGDEQSGLTSAAVEDFGVDAIQNVNDSGDCGDGDRCRGAGGSG